MCTTHKAVTFTPSGPGLAPLALGVGEMILVNKDWRQRIDSCWALRHMEQMRSLLADPLFLPGDFVIDGAPAVSLASKFDILHASYINALFFKWLATA